MEGVDNKALKRKVKVYDVDKKELIAEFDSIYDTAKFCGVNSGAIWTSIQKKCRCYKNSLNKTLTFR